MSDDLQKMATWLDPLISRLTPAKKRKLLRDLITTLRQRNQRRITQQRNVDGSPFAPRKKQLRSKTGRIRKAPMFTKLRQAKYMRTTATSSQASIAITGRAGMIANVHHKGLRDYVNRRRSNLKTQYEERQLLGFAPTDKQHVLNVITRHLEKQK